MMMKTNNLDGGSGEETVMEGITGGLPAIKNECTKKRGRKSEMSFMEILCIIFPRAVLNCFSEIEKRVSFIFRASQTFQ